MELIHTEPRESEEAAEIVRGLGWLLHNDQLEAGSFAGMCDTALGAGAQFHRRQFNRTVCVHGGGTGRHDRPWHCRTRR
jgi:hypothetical protein